MSEQQPSRWRPTRRQLLWAGGVAALAFLIIVICGYLFGWKWTGLPKRTLWDWLDLLIVPAVLALGGYLFTRSENRRTQEEADQQRMLDRELADERRQDEMLQAYLDGMSQLLTDKERPLHRAEPGDYLSTVARARTLTVLARLEGMRKGSAMQFLSESGLISSERPVLDLSGADLRKANLVWTDLRRANLTGATLVEANLTGAILRAADLSAANLIRADLTAVRLSEANLTGAILAGATLIGAELRGAILRVADLRGTNLSRADLSAAVLNIPGLPFPNPSGPNLSGANLSEAEGITNEELESVAKSLEGATMPNGQKYEEWIKSKGRKEDGENGGSS